MSYPIVNCRELTDVELEEASGGLLKEISVAVKTLIDAATDALVISAMKGGCLMNPDGGIGACPPNPPPI